MAGPIPIFTIQPFRHAGGPPIQHISFLKAIDPDQFEFHVLIEANHVMERDYRQVAASVHTLADLATVPRNLSPIRLYKYWSKSHRVARDIAKMAESVGASAIYTFNEAFPAGGMAARLLGVPSVYHIIAMSVFYPKVVGKLWSHVLNGISDHILCCQNIIKEKLSLYGVADDKLTVAYNCIDPEAVRRLSRTMQRPNVSDDCLKIGMVAGMAPRKGQIAFIQAAAIVCKRMDNVRFFIIGDTRRNEGFLGLVQKTIAEHKLQDKLILTHWVPAIEPWISAMDIYVNASLTEALSVAIIEAMALERPVVATRVDGNPIAVVDGETGFLCSPGDPADMAEKLLILLKDEGKRRFFGRNGRDRVLNLFTIQKNSALVESALKAALKI